MTSALDEANWPRTQKREYAASWILLVAISLYSASLMKFFVRDPLSADPGLQGPIELALLILAGITLLLAFHRRYLGLFLTPSAKAFLVFGGLAIASSIFSYDRSLSFARGVMFILVCCIAIGACNAFTPQQVIKYLYYSVFLIVIAGLAIRIASHVPLLETDDYSRRARLSIFALDPGSLADLCAVVLLSSFFLSKRPAVYCQLFFLAISIATSSRASTALLVLALVVLGLTLGRLTPRVLLLCGLLGAVLTLAIWIAPSDPNSPASTIASLGQNIYGDKLHEDLPTLNGRTEVWHVAGPLILRSMFFGFGLDGVRNILLSHTSWPAGHAHNAMLDLILAAGVPATLVFLVGWGGSIGRALHCRRTIRIKALVLYSYMAAFGITEANLTLLQFLAVFLIITVDSILCVECLPQADSARALRIQLPQHAERRCDERA
ncbi:MAG: O-antigen ligase family protein [Terracidiphilus sp.]